MRGLRRRHGNGEQYRKPAPATLLMAAIAFGVAVLGPLRWPLGTVAASKRIAASGRDSRGGGEAFAAGKQVLVTGAGGKTGKLVVEQLLAKGGFQVRALVRSNRAKQELLGRNPALQPNNIFVGDILKPETLGTALAGCTALVVVTSAVPKIRIWSLVKTILGRLVGKKNIMPRFCWKNNQKPEQVDWEGQKTQFDAALAAGISRIVVVGSMGGTQPDNFLNKIGDGEGGDKILMWKRKAEVYLIEQCKERPTSYTIVHPGGLTNTPGGERRLAIGVDDELLKRKVRSISRADVAAICVEALTCKDAENRSFDVCADPPEEGKPEPLAGAGFTKLLGGLEGKNCDYSLNPPP